MHTVCFNINNKIRAIRLAKGYSQEYMAFRLQISQQSYSRLESGRQDWRLTQLVDAADILEVCLWELIGDSSRGEDDLSIRGLASLLTKIHQSLERIA